MEGLGDGLAEVAMECKVGIQWVPELAGVEGNEEQHREVNGAREER